MGPVLPFSVVANPLAVFVDAPPLFVRLPLLIRLWLAVAPLRVAVVPLGKAPARVAGAAPGAPSVALSVVAGLLVPFLSSRVRATVS